MTLRLSSKARRTLARHPKGKLTLRTVFKSRATGSKLVSTRTVVAAKVK